VAVDPEEVVVDVGKRTMTLAELAMTAPGMARIMPEVGARIWKLYYAGKAQNWPLARFQLKEAVNLMELGSFMRPKYEENMGKFIEEQVGTLSKAIENRDVDAFVAAFDEMVSQANAYHELYDKPFLRWRVPDFPPPDLDMTPRE
jgi:hypothetical protein